MGAVVYMASTTPYHHRPSLALLFLRPALPRFGPLRLTRFVKSSEIAVPEPGEQTKTTLLDPLRAGGDYSIWLLHAVFMRFYSGARLLGQFLRFGKVRLFFLLKQLKNLFRTIDFTWIRVININRARLNLSSRMYRKNRYSNWCSNDSTYIKSKSSSESDT